MENGQKTFLPMKFDKNRRMKGMAKKKKNEIKDEEKCKQLH